MSERQERIDSIRVIIQRLNGQVTELTTELHKLETEQFREEHPCSCVRLNGDIEIYDMAEQSRRNREPLQLGAVYATHSARKDCTTCHGTGKPAPEHNHLGEVFSPDTCPACRVLQRNID